MSKVEGVVEAKVTWEPKEAVVTYDDTKTTPVLGFKARQVIDLGATYDVTDANGQPIGLFRKNFAASLLRSTRLPVTLGLVAGKSLRWPR